MKLGQLKLICILGFSIIVIPSLSFASSYTQMSHNLFLNNANTYAGYLTLSKQKRLGIAQNFGLTPKEYQTYLYDMSYTPDKFYYNKQNSNPLWVLAAHTQNNPALYKHYIDESVRISYQETGRMLKVNRDFVTEAHRIYPNQLPVMTPQMRAKGLMSGDTIRLYCKINSPTCSNILPILINRVKKTDNTQLDIFLVGKISTSQIEKFGQNNSIPRNLVSSGTITLNFGNAPFKDQESEAHKTLPLPYVSILRGGRQIPVNLSKGAEK